MPTKLRFGLIGAGRMGARRLKSVLGNEYGAAAGVFDVEADRAQTLAAELACNAFASEAALLASPEIDCVIISTPNKYHPASTVAALESGKHVFLEKPLARNPEEALAMVEASARTGRSLKVGSNLRYFPSVVKAKELLDAGEIGRTLFLRGWVGNNGWQLDSWFSDAEVTGGGAFLDNGCHLLDISRWFLGEAVEATGFVTTLHWQIAPQEDNGMGIIRFASGELAYIQACWTEWHEYCYLEVYGSEGLIRIDNRLPHCTTSLRRRTGEEEQWDYSDLPPRSYQAEMDDFIDAMRSGREPSPSGFDGMRAVQMSYAVYESSRSGRTTSLWGEREQALQQRLTGNFGARV